MIREDAEGVPYFVQRIENGARYGYPRTLLVTFFDGIESLIDIDILSVYRVVDKQLCPVTLLAIEEQAKKQWYLSKKNEEKSAVKNSK